MVDPDAYKTFAVIDPDKDTYGGDYETIIDAINAGETAIFLRSGVHTTRDSVGHQGHDIVVPRGCHIVGESAYNTVVDFEDESWNFILNADDVIIENLTVINCGSPLGAFEFSGATNCWVKNCRIEGGTRAATFVSSTYCIFESNMCLGQNLESVYIDELSTDNRINNNRITDGKHYGIFVAGAWNKFVLNTVAGCTYDGICLIAANNVVHTNTCNQNANGIYVAKENGDHNSIQGNICRNNKGYGINVNSLENAGNVVVGNILRDNTVADLRFVPGNFAAYNDAVTVV